MSMGIAGLFMLAVSLVGPAPKGTPGTLQVKPGQTIVAIGDSITAAGGYLRMSEAFLAEHYPDRKIPEIINAGINAQKAEDLVLRFQQDVIDRRPAIVMISIGINDVWHRLGAPHEEKILAAYRQNLKKMVDMAQKAGIKVILLTPTVIEEDPKSEGNRRLSMYVEAQKQIAGEKKCQLLDLHQMFLDALEKKPADGGPTWLTVDGVHMRPLGDAIMAIGVLRGLGVRDAMLSALDPAEK